MVGGHGGFRLAAKPQHLRLYSRKKPEEKSGGKSCRAKATKQPSGCCNWRLIRRRQGNEAKVLSKPTLTIRGDSENLGIVRSSPQSACLSSVTGCQKPKKVKGGAKEKKSTGQPS